MKFLHTGDLHIGKRLFEASVLEDQAHILEQIYEIALEERVQAVVLARFGHTNPLPVPRDRKSVV